MVRDDRFISFQALREHAINFADDEDTKPKHQGHQLTKSEERERMDELSLKVEELSKGQAMILEKMSNVGNRWQPNPRHSQNLKCYQPGHFKQDCPMRRVNSQRQTSSYPGTGQNSHQQRNGVFQGNRHTPLH